MKIWKEDTEHFKSFRQREEGNKRLYSKIYPETFVFGIVEIIFRSWMKDKIEQPPGEAIINPIKWKVFDFYIGGS